ncbi:MAG TPA: VCBS repeat-containing protein [Thermoanaerobaculia bacterium]|nr:VCBS repeat-containing protein [Thermoanaerobaculia bacterium]
MSATHTSISFRRFGAYLLAFPLAAALGACSQQPAAAVPADGAQAASAAPSATPAPPAPDATQPAASPAVSPAEAAVAAPGGESAPGGIEYPQPPDGKWLTDPEGRQYFVHEVPKVERTYMWLDEKQTKVRIGYGETYDVVGHDDKSFRVKMYRVDQPPPPSKADVAADRESVAATYRADVAQADRLMFLPFERGLPDSGQWRNGFEIADMNGDGTLDIVFGSVRKGRRLPNIYLGDGKGGWRLWAEGKFPNLAYDYGDVAVADFNGDRLPDLALGVHLRGILLLASDGPGRFKEWGKGLDFEVPGVAGSAATGFSSRAVVAADWNGDGRPDIVALGEGPRFAATEAARNSGPGDAFGMVVYLNQGDGSWVRRSDSEKDKIFGDDLAVGDLNGDGRLDAVLGSNVLGERSILRFGEEGGGWRVGSVDVLRPAGYVQSVEMGDFDRDGRVDLLVGYTASEGGVWRSGIDVLYNRPGEKWERRPLAAEEHREGVFALAVGDLDGDRTLDAAALTGTGATWVFIGDGKGFFRREQGQEITAPVGGCRGYGLQIADLDGDGTGELVSSFAGEASALFAPNRCPQQGGVTAWKAQLNEGEQPAAR